ncbi:MAG TPA: hypothetical protein PK760_05785, partial [Flavobacteriales bacterium]|nr:hypothetical protein [Flavobacteriales bacterium]
TTLLLLGILAAAVASAQNIGINVNGAAPHTSALLDVDAAALPANGKRGLLIPRVTTAERTSIASPATGLLVYDTTTNGFWFWNGSAWVPFLSSSNGWSTTGNAGTVDGTHFLGTTDNVPLNFRVNNERAGRITHADSTVTFGYRAGASLTTAKDNVIIGERAGENITTASSHVLIGSQTGRSLTTAWGNVHIGDHAGTNCTTGGNSTFVGAYAGSSTTTGIGLTFLGCGAGVSNTTGSSNTFVGQFTASNNTTGSANVALGNGSFNANTSGYDNVAIGMNAGFWGTTSYHNISIGRESGFNNNGYDNVFVGDRTGRSNTTGYENTYLGWGAGYSGTTCNDNVAIGNAAGYYNLTGYSNCFVGADAGQASTGFGNTCIGRAASVSMATGDRCVSLGYNANTNTGLTNAIAIGAFAQVTASNSLVLGGTGANAVKVGIGVTAPAAELEVNGYTMLGSNAPAVKMLKLTGTTAATQGGQISIAHGLTPAKILSVDVLIEYAAGSWVPAAYTGSVGYLCNYYINGGNIWLWNLSGGSANILSKPVKILITYEA